MKKLVMLALAVVVLASALATAASAFVFRNVTAEKAAEWQRYLDYKSNYAEFYGLDGYEQYFSEYNLQRNFGFRPNSYYYPTPGVWNAKYNPPLQGEVYSTINRPRASSLDQPSAVKYYGEKINGRYSGLILPDLNGVYFDHPSARQTYGYLNAWGGYGYGQQGNARFYARVADQVTDDYYIVGFY